MKWKNLWVCLFLSALMTWNAGAQPKQGSVAPDISLPDPNGQVLSLSALRGKMVLVDFWASWCGPCRVTNKKIKPLYEAYQAAGFEIYGVSVDNNAEAWKKAIKADGITWLQVNQLRPQAFPWQLFEAVRTTWVDQDKGPCVVRLRGIRRGMVAQDIHG